MRVYLDQNHWIALARILHGKDGDSTSRDLLGTLNDAVNAGSVTLPLSRIHLLEAMKVADDQKRLRLIQAFLFFSRGWVVRPAELVMAEELGRWQGGDAARAATPIGRGLLAALGDYRKLAQTLGLPVEAVEHEDSMGDHPAAWYFVLSRPEFAAPAPHIRAVANRYVTTVESVRARWAALPAEQRQSLYAQGVLSDLEAALSPVPPEVESAISRLLSLERTDFLSAFRQIPTIDVLVAVGEAIARNTNQPTKPNDLWDLAFLSVAIP